MKILVIGNFGASWDGSMCDEEHIASALESIGHEVVRAQRNSDLFSFAESKDYSFVLIAQWDGYGDLPYFYAPIVYWAFDYQEEGQPWHEELVARSKLYLSKPLSDSKYPNWHWLSQDFSPEFLDKAPVVEKDIDVLFTGSWVPWESGKERVKILKAIDQRFNLQINTVTPGPWIGEGFKNVQGPVMDQDLPDLIARAKVNFSMDHVYAPGYWSDRNAQIMCCGGFVLFRHVPMSEAIFRDHIAYFYKEEDCLRSIDHWLNDNSRREIIAEAGYQYAQKYLKASDRVQDMLKIVQEVL